MIVVMLPTATEEQTEGVVGQVRERGLQVHISRGERCTVIGVVGNTAEIDPDDLAALPGVDRVVRVMKPYRLAHREARPEGTRVTVRWEGGSLTVGGREIVLAAGPCAVEDEGSLMETARAVGRAGAAMLRGGAFKPRTSPYSFQGLGHEGLLMLARARRETGLPVVTEVMAPEQVAVVATYADMLQIGTRNMFNYPLLRAVGRTRCPVLLKRGMMATIEEWLLAAEYILAGGNPNVILCERGIRTFEGYTRNTLDLSAVPVVKSLSHLPVWVDPSHGTGRAELVIPMARAAIAAGADGLLVEVHGSPMTARSDGSQSLTPEQFGRLVEECRSVAEALGRGLAPGPAQARDGDGAARPARDTVHPGATGTGRTHQGARGVTAREAAS
ncbi:MAG: 3-deoxy-7-phosphoheptulonate synthase [Bacillota bacterium]|nr:3-deoxy-7-phosphoheptulonate synthase [Bacillota bacterium]